MKKKIIKLKFIFVIIFLLMLILLFSISIYQCIKWISDKYKTDNQVLKITNMKNEFEIEDNENTEIIEQKEIELDNPYWKYIKMNLIDVNFTELEKINSSTVGWIKVNGTNINYPFVQTTNNEFYLKHSFDKSKNSAGWIFMDYRNNLAEFDKNTIIYGHGRLDNTMFGTLKKILTNGWLENDDNHIIKISTKYENSIWQVFSVYKIPTTTDYLETEFYDNQEFLEFANYLLNRSAYNFNTFINENDKIITLSTCYDDNNKVVLHAKLIKYEKK